MKNKKKTDGVVRRTMAQEVLRNYRHSFGAMLGTVIIVLVLIIGIAGNIYYDYDGQVIKQSIANSLQAPSAEHWFGTDELGRDIFTRVIYGTRYSLSVAFFSMVVCVVVGVTLGALAGYYGGSTETVIMRFADIILSIPPMLFGICIVAAFGQNIIILMLAIAISGTPAVVRITRAAVLQERGKEYVEAARATGVRDVKIILVHVLPNALAPILVQATLHIGGAIISIAALSFLGLGVQPPMPEWGAMLSSGRAYIRGYGYMTLYPGLAIMIVVLGFNLIGDGLRDAMDPKLKR